MNHHSCLPVECETCQLAIKRAPPAYTRGGGSTIIRMGEGEREKAFKSVSYRKWHSHGCQHPRPQTSQPHAGPAVLLYGHGRSATDGLVQAACE